MDGLGLLLAAGAFSFAAEYIDSSLGMGYGTSLTPILLLLGFEPLDVVPAVLMSEFVTAFLATGMHRAAGNVSFARRSVARRATALLASVGVLGTAVGVALAFELPPRFQGTYIGAMVLTMGVLLLATRRRALRFSWRKLAGAGLLAAFNKGIAGGGYGALITGGQILAGEDPKSAIGVTSFTEGVVSLVGAAIYLLLRGTFDAALAVALVSGAALSTPLAAFTVRRLRVPQLRVAVGAASCALGAVTLFRFAGV